MEDQAKYATMHSMVTTAHTKTDRLLTEVLREVREVRALVEPISRAVATPKKESRKFPAWLRASLQDEKEGRVSGPFAGVKELMKHLEKK